MVNVSTLVYVLENLEQERIELFDVKEIFELEESLLGKISGTLDPSDFLASPNLVEEVLRRASIV